MCGMYSYNVGFNLSCYFIHSAINELSDGEKIYTRQLLLVCQYTNDYSLLYYVKYSHLKFERGWGPKTSLFGNAFICSTFNYDYIFFVNCSRTSYLLHQTHTVQIRNFKSTDVHVSLLHRANDRLII